MFLGKIKWLTLGNFIGHSVQLDWKNMIFIRADLVDVCNVAWIYKGGGLYKRNKIRSLVPVFLAEGSIWPSTVSTVPLLR